MLRNSHLRKQESSPVLKVLLGIKINNFHAHAKWHIIFFIFSYLIGKYSEQKVELVKFFI